MLIITVLIGSVALISDWSVRSRWRGRRDSGGGSSEGAGAIFFAIWLAAAILAPILTQLVAMSVSRNREYLADASGAELTRNPIALVSALEKIDSKRGPTRSMQEGTAHLCICDPRGSKINNIEGAVADLFATHPPIGKRVEALKQMAYTG
jgi:heat shock protein HtpX